MPTMLFVIFLLVLHCIKAEETTVILDTGDKEHPGSESLGNVFSFTGGTGGVQ